MRFCFRIKRYLSAHLDPFLSYPHGNRSSDVWLAQLSRAAVNSVGTQVLEHVRLLLRRPRPDNESKWNLTSWSVHGSDVLVGWQGWCFAKAGKEKRRKEEISEKPPSKRWGCCIDRS